MRATRNGNHRGMSLLEVVITATVSLMAAAVVIQVLTLTVRTADQTAVQADAQNLARETLAVWERQLRDGYAILAGYTVPGTTDTYTTDIGEDEQVLVAALPSVDVDGNPCSWRGVNVVFDCMIWIAEKVDDGWNLSRLTFTNAFQMPDAYFTRRSDPRFFSLICGQTPTYTVPGTFGRPDETSPVPIVTGASDLTIELRDEGGVLAPTDTATQPPVVSTGVVRPVLVDMAGAKVVPATPVQVTGATVVRVSLQFSKSVAALQGGGSVIESDRQATSIRLRNRPNW